MWDEKEALDKDLQDFATYQDKRLSIIEKYSQSRQRLQEQGYDEQAAEASAQMQKELQELDKEHSKELLKYKYLYDKIEHLSINMLKDRIGKIKETLADADLTEEIQSDALRALSAA